MNVCPNCSVRLEGEYCARCGQRRIHPEDLSARDFFRKAVDDVASLRTNFKTVRTLRALGALVIALALMRQLSFRTQMKPFGAHLILVSHYVSLIYLVSIAGGLDRRALGPSQAVDIAVYALLVPYLIVALKGVYAEPTAVILLKAGGLLLLIVALNIVATLTAVRLTLALV